MVATGEKRIETRSWPTAHRGVIAIHAAKRQDESLRAIYNSPAFSGRLARHGYGDSFSSLPFGRVVALAELLGCLTVTKYNQPQTSESLFGDYRLGRYMWFLGKIIELRPAIEATGRQGLWVWQVPPEVEDAVRSLAPWGGLRTRREA